MRKSIIICEFLSTGINYVDDALARGFVPVLLESFLAGVPSADEIRELRARIYQRVKDKVRIIRENPDYEEVLRQARAYEPAAVVAGSEAGVELSVRLAADLGLPGNPPDRIPAMTVKSAMHQALKEHGLRSIRGKVIRSEEEAVRFYRELGKEHVVVKPARGAASSGVYLCRGEDEMLEAVRRHLDEAKRSDVPSVMIQERIFGTEYVVNTVSCGGRHRVVSAGVYEKHRLSNGTNAYSYFRYITSLGIGHSRLMNYACRVADAIGIQYGPVHGEYMIDEEGPVLIEVNCRPMGGGLGRKYSELVSGQHETDAALDSYLDPDKFNADAMKPYRLRRCGVSKDLVLSSDTEVRSAPVLQICRRLRSYYSASFDMIGKTDFLPQTTDMSTEAGLVYLVHDDELQVREDCELLCLLETKYPRILYQDWKYGTEAEESTKVSAKDGRCAADGDRDAKEGCAADGDRDVKEGCAADGDRDATEGGNEDEALASEKRLTQLMNAEGCRGAALIFSDTLEDMQGASVVSTTTLRGAYDSFEYGILDLSKRETFADLESIIQQIFVFMDKVRVGGRILVPESTYRNLPYGIEGMEILFKASGMVIELPSASSPGLMTATVQ